MKRLRWGICILIFLFLSACAGVPAAGSTEEITAWQDYYDLGVRYLSEGNYEEAVIAFTSAIEIDPKQAAAYIGRGDAYRALAEAIDSASNENERRNFLEHAADDYKMAIDLDGANPETYQKLAEIYVALNDDEATKAILEQGYSETGEPSLKEFLENKLREMKAAQIKLNVYGGTEFTERNDYRAFSDFTLSEQEYIQTIATAALSMDLETIKGTLGFQFERYEHRAYWTGYTMWDGYKLYIYTSETKTTDDGDNHSSMDMEIRPETGTGHFISVTHIEPVASLNEDSWSDSYFIEWKSCSCSDWQWNGHFEETIQHLFFHTWADGSTCETEEVYRTEGEMHNSLRTGMFSTETHTSEVWSKWSDMNSESSDSYTSIYHDGWMVEDRGNPIEKPGPTKMDGSCGGTLDEQWVRDEFYW